MTGYFLSSRVARSAVKKTPSLFPIAVIMALEFADERHCRQQRLLWMADPQTVNAMPSSCQWWMKLRMNEATFHMAYGTSKLWVAPMSFPVRLYWRCNWNCGMELTCRSTSAACMQWFWRWVCLLLDSGKSESSEKDPGLSMSSWVVYFPLRWIHKQIRRQMTSRKSISGYLSACHVPGPIYATVIQQSSFCVQTHMLRSNATVQEASLPLSPTHR